MKSSTTNMLGAIITFVMIVAIFGTIHADRITKYFGEKRQAEACLELKKEAIKAGQPSPDCKL